MMKSCCDYLGKCFRGETDLDNNGVEDHKQLIEFLENYLKKRQKNTEKMRRQNFPKSLHEERKILHTLKNNDDQNPK